MDAMKKVRKQPTGWEKLQIMYTYTHTHMIRNLELVTRIFKEFITQQ